ncbi:MAG: radical SAM protein, partial [Thermoplasmata archaeon]
ALVRAFSGARRLLFETLPEFPTDESLGPLKDAFPGELEVALGLESTDPVILRRYINKGASPLEYLQAADRVRSFGTRAKGYLLLKPPYLTEEESVQDVVRSVAAAAEHFDALSINPVHIQNGTVVEWLYHRGRYRPPWLWSVVEALNRGASVRGSSRLVSFPTAGGLPRGPHNCGKCDAKVLAAIQDASLDQKFEGLAELDCSCRTEYAALRGLEVLGVET